MTIVRDLDHAVDAFEGELARRGRTKATRQKYREVLYPFVEMCGDLLPWEVTPDHCRRYLDRWIDASPSTLALYVSILNQFFTFLHEEEIIERNPMERIKRPPLKRPEELDVTTVSSEDVERLYAAAEEWDELLCLAAITYLGPRRSALGALRRGDVDLERGTIRFREKGAKIITKPIPAEFSAILRAAEENGVWTGPRDYLVPNRRETRSAQRSPKVIYAIVKRLAERAGVDVHPHALRAAFAVQFDEQHPDQLIALKELMGHSRVETTLVYLRRKDKAKAMEQVRDLSWGAASAFPPSADVPPTGFEPVLGEDTLAEPLRSKLEALRARSSRERA